MDSVIANRHRTSLCAEVSALAEPTEGATAVDVAACDESVHSAGYHELDDARALVDLDLGLDIIARTLRKRADLLDAVACVEDVPAGMSIVLPDLAGSLAQMARPPSGMENVTSPRFVGMVTTCPPVLKTIAMSRVVLMVVPSLSSLPPSTMNDSPRTSNLILAMMLPLQLWAVGLLPRCPVTRP